MCQSAPYPSLSHEHQDDYPLDRDLDEECSASESRTYYHSDVSDDLEAREPGVGRIMNNTVLVLFTISHLLIAFQIHWTWNPVFYSHHLFYGAEDILYSPVMQFLPFPPLTRGLGSMSVFSFLFFFHLCVVQTLILNLDLWFHRKDANKLRKISKIGGGGNSFWKLIRGAQKLAGPGHHLLTRIPGLGQRLLRYRRDLEDYNSQWRAIATRGLRTLWAAGIWCWLPVSEMILMILNDKDCVVSMMPPW